MPRRTADSILAATAIFFIIVGQGFVLIPDQFDVLLAGLPQNSALVLGGFFLASGLICFPAALTQTHKAHQALAATLAQLALGVLAALYARAQMLIEATLPILLMLALLFSTRAWPRVKARSIYPIAALTFLFCALAIFLHFDWFPIPLENIDYVRWALGAVFALSGLLLLLRIRQPGPAPLRRSRLVALPSAFYMLTALADGNIASAILPLCWVTLTLAQDFAPFEWRKLKFERRFYLYFLLSALVGFLASLGFTRLFTIIFADPILRAQLTVTTIVLITEIAWLTRILLNAHSQIKLKRTFSSSANESASKEKPASPESFLRQISNLQDQLAAEKRRNLQLNLLSELSQQLEAQLDAPVAAQLMINMLQQALHCDFAGLYNHELEKRELTLLAAAGQKMSLFAPGHRQNINHGILGRAARLRKTQAVADTSLDIDFEPLSDEQTLALIAVPLIDHGHLRAVLEVSADHVNAFTNADLQLVEAAAGELLRAWERSDYHNRLAHLIQAGISLTNQPDPQAAAQEVAAIARQTLQARFAYVTLLGLEGSFTRVASSGLAPNLLNSFGTDPALEPLLQATLNADRPFRVRDVRKYKNASHLNLDDASLRSMIAIPIRMHRLSVGAMLAFGKQGSVFFTENDETLASLLSSQAAAAIESAWLSHELRTTFSNATQLYQLSYQVIQAEELSVAAKHIAETTRKICSASSVGILLLRPDGQTEAEVQIDANGAEAEISHPLEIIGRAIETGQSIYHSPENDASTICHPLKTPSRTYGALWLTIPDERGSHYAANAQTLANQAAVALERSILLVESREQAEQIESAYKQLSQTYDMTLAALMSALDARDQETEGHSLRVANIARLLGEHMHLSPDQLKVLERGSLLHDIGKIGISDTILHKSGPLDENEWKIMRLHPDIGARIVEDIPFLQDSLSVVRYHQERWDGSGYPLGLSGLEIPLLARIFAVADTLDALTSLRPYRTKISPAEALQYLREQAGILYDPAVLAIFQDPALLDAISEFVEDPGRRQIEPAS